jgi:fatty acid desaturase
MTNAEINTKVDPVLDRAKNVPLAPISGRDSRRDLPESLYRKKPARFAVKFGFAVMLITVCYVLIAVDLSWESTILAMLVAGLIYGHLTVLQHEAIHEPFDSRWLNRLLGLACGVFTFSSYSHYKYDHVRHHASLGTPANREFFNYRFFDLSKPAGMIKATFHLGRYVEVGRNIVRSIIGRPIVNASNKHANARIREEYLLFLLMAVGVLVFTLLTGNMFFILAWVIPALFIAEPAHFLVELPEHFGLNTQTNPNVLANTRTIRAGNLAQWYTNFNNLHTAHHYHQGVPMANVRMLNSMIHNQYEVVESSYWTFYRKVLSGALKYDDPSITCMTR